jgi:glucose-6-phosphate 1-dehydrogenase
MNPKDTYIGQYKGYPFLPSSTPTFVETQVSWRGIPITVKAGKALAERLVEIRLHFADDTLNKRINVQPYGAVMDGNKSLLLDFNRPEDAYEIAIGDVFTGDHTRFVSMSEVEESWKIVDDIIRMDITPFEYEPGMSV